MQKKTGKWLSLVVAVGLLAGIASVAGAAEHAGAWRFSGTNGTWSFTPAGGPTFKIHIDVDLGTADRTRTTKDAAGDFDHRAQQQCWQGQIKTGDWRSARPFRLLTSLTPLCSSGEGGTGAGRGWFRIPGTNIP